MVLFSFQSRLFPGNKKDLCPHERTQIKNGSLGQKSENFCGATQIGEKLARS